MAEKSKKRICEGNFSIEGRDDPLLKNLLSDAEDESQILRRGLLDPKLLPNPYIRGLPLKKDYSLKKYQVDVIKWSLGRKCGFLSMQMGLGKTITAIALSATDQKYVMPSLIVCPLNVVTNWVEDGFKKFFGNFYKVFVFHPTHNDLEQIDFYKLCEYDYVVTSYENIVKSAKINNAFSWYIDFNKTYGLGTTLLYSPPSRNRLNLDYKGPGILHRAPWAHIIFDESHLCANQRTSRFKACYSLFGLKHWCLTGTKITNKTANLWSQMALLHLNPLFQSNADKYKDLATIYRNKDQYIAEMNYESVQLKMPPIEKYRVDITLDKEHIKYYLEASQKMEEAIIQFGLDKQFSAVLAKLMLFRLVSISPRLAFPGGPIGSKIPAIISIIKRIVARREKVVVMSGFNMALELLGDILTKEGIGFVSMTGKSKVSSRDSLIEKFRSDPKCFVFLSTYKVGGVGINLQFATNWISVEPWWNEAVHRQGYQRIWRMGQEKLCKTYFFTIRGIEEQILVMCAEKEDISRASEGRALDFADPNQLSLEQIRKMARSTYGVQTLDKKYIKIDVNEKRL